jgi:nicotinate-nucleotide pyrophosphorylase (carboxylating)
MPKSEEKANTTNKPGHLTIDPRVIANNVATALAEDIGCGDISARLIPQDQLANAQLISRQPAVICGLAWAEETLNQVDSRLRVNWQVKDGEQVVADQLLAEFSGPARPLLTAERTLLNFLQTLSATATRCRTYANLVAGYPVRLLDTRKTLPGLRIAQKYAVTCGGCYNHRLGLYDAFLIKENHISACGSIAQAVSLARQQQPASPIEVEVETLAELNQALAVQPDRIMLDNFKLAELKEAVAINQGQVELETSGNITEATILAIAATGVDFISIGSLTKDCQAVDLSLRFL